MGSDAGLAWSRSELVALDPITLEIIQESMISIVREMRANLIATAYSSVIHEAHDFRVFWSMAKGRSLPWPKTTPRIFSRCRGRFAR